MEALYNFENFFSVVESDAFMSPTFSFTSEQKKVDLKPILNNWAQTLYADADAPVIFRRAGLFHTGLVNIARKSVKNNPELFQDGLFFSSVIADYDNTLALRTDNINLTARSLVSARVISDLIKSHPLGKALSENQVIGILANLAVESKFDPSIVEGNSRMIWSYETMISKKYIAFGLGQFTRAEGCQALENIYLAALELKGVERLAVDEFALCLLNPVYQVDHLLRTVFGKARVNAADRLFNHKLLVKKGFFDSNISLASATTSFLYGYERPADPDGVTGKHRVENATALKSVL